MVAHAGSNTCFGSWTQKLEATCFPGHSDDCPFGAMCGWDLSSDGVLQMGAQICPEPGNPASL